MELLEADDWPTLVDVSLDLGGSLDLPTIPPQKNTTSGSTQPLIMDENLYLDGYGQMGDFPYLGNLFQHAVLTPIETNSDLINYPGTGRLFALNSDPEPHFFCEFTDGSRKTGAIFNGKGKQLDLLRSGYDHVSSHKSFIATIVNDQLTVFDTSKGTFSELAILSLSKPISYLQNSAVRAIPSKSIFFSDWQFEIIGEKMVVWGFNVSTTAFLPDYLHIKMEGNLGSGDLELVQTFGVPTLADRLPVPGRSVTVLRKDETFWVPRLHDPQIDVFHLDGQLLKTISLNALPQSMNPGPPLSSGAMVETAIGYAMPNDFFAAYNKAPMIVSVHNIKDHVVVTRLNLGSRDFPRIYTLLNREGQVILPEATGLDFLFQGSHGSGALFLTKFRTVQTHFPPWMKNSPGVTPQKIKQYEEGYWLVDVQI